METPPIYIEACENYQKQSWRNRCLILGPNGVEMLQVPVVHGSANAAASVAGGWHSGRLAHFVRSAPPTVSCVPASQELVSGGPLPLPVAGGGHAPGVPPSFHSARSISAVRVDYSTPWIVRSERALDAAYLSSPFYEHYRDGIFAILESRPETLLGLNTALTRHILGRLGISVELRLTEDFAVPGSVPDDYRGMLHPKRPNTVLRDLGLGRPYYQVFAQKFGGFTPGLSILDLLFNEGPDALLFLKLRGI